MKLVFTLSRTKQNNEMISSNDRLHFAIKAKRTAMLRNLGKIEARNYILSKKGKFKMFNKSNPCTVNVIIYSPTKRRLDPPNFYPTIKALVDGMTDAGVWSDDNHEVIKRMSFEYGGLSGDKRYRVELEIEKMLKEM